MSTQPQLSPIEQLMQGSQPTSASAQPQGQDTLSPIERLMQQPSTQPAHDVGTTVKPQSSMVDQVLGALAPQSVPQTTGAGAKQGDEGGFEGMLASGDQGKANFMSGAGGAALLTLLGANYGPGALEAVKAAAQSHPLVAKVLLHGLETAGGWKVAKMLHVFDGK
jgi:hypothetical protein